jgi:hypothetical protein
MKIPKIDISNEWDNPKSGLHNAVLIDVIDKGLQTWEFNGESKQAHKIRLLWEVEEKTSGGRPMMAAKSYTKSLAPNSNLRAMLRSWLGREMSEQELNNFDTDDLIGRPAQVLVTSYKKHGESRVYVEEVRKPLGDKQLKPSGEYIRMQDREGYEPPGQSAEPMCSGKQWTL